LRSLQHLTNDPDERDQVALARPAVHEAVERRRVSGGLEPADIFGRTLAHDREQPLDRLQHARDAAERERRRTERHHFHIVGPRVAPHDLNRVGRGVFGIEAVVQPIELHLHQSCHSAILQS